MIHSIDAMQRSIYRQHDLPRITYRRTQVKLFLLLKYLNQHVGLILILANLELHFLLTSYLVNMSD